MSEQDVFRVRVFLVVGPMKTISGVVKVEEGQQTVRFWGADGRVRAAFQTAQLVGWSREDAAVGG